MSDETTTDKTTTDESGTLDFAAWLEAQPDDVKKLVDGKMQRLHGDLHSEREQRKTFAKQVKEMTSKVEAGSETAKQLTELSGKLETEQKRADFYEKAVDAGCKKPRTAWILAQADDLTIEQVKAANPELFTAKASTNGGNGAGSGGGGEKQDMNTLIRKKAGR